MTDLGKWEQDPEKNKFELRHDLDHMSAWGSDKLLRVVTWKDGDGDVWFRSGILFWYIRWYFGKFKLDGTRTKWYWQGWLSDGVIPVAKEYVVNLNPAERWSLRFRSVKPDRERWDNVGGI